MQGMLPAAGPKVQAWIVVLSLALLAGCVDPTIYRPDRTAPLERRAIQAEVDLRHLEAAELYRQLAAASEGEQQTNYLLRSAEQLLAAGEPAAAQKRLETVALPRDTGIAARLRVTQAYIALAQGNADTALARIDSLGSALPTGLIGEALLVRGQALFQLDRPTEAITTLVEREPWLSRSDQVLGNHEVIWQGLKDTVPLEPQASGDPIVDGWLGLLPIAQRANLEPLAIRQALIDWKALQPSHPASAGLIVQLLDQIRQLTDYPNQIAVLLPLGGRQQAAAQALRDGMMAAHWTDTRIARPRLKIYDTSGVGATQAYTRALAEGADFVVGPLLKKSVENVALLAGSVPTLALNYLEEIQQVVPGFYQFALAPEDEAREVARQAIAEGHLNAVVLVPNSDWGIRILTSFSGELEAYGGAVLEFRGYETGVQDFTGSITGLLKLSESNQRYRRLAANLGQNVEFEPRRRRDVDFIFLVADSRAGRLLMPQLRFHYAGDLPTYATAEIFEPGGRGNNSDLNGVIYPDASMLIAPNIGSEAVRTSLERHWPRRGQRLSRLYAMGFDAYRLIPRLNRSSNPTEVMHSGLSGHLSLDQEGRVHRQLEFAQMRGGQPERLVAPLVSEEIASITQP
jgi:outer membrane PBP1 activator LpoA protein